MSAGSSGRQALNHWPEVAAAVLSDRYVTDRFLPDKAIDLMDEASAKARTIRAYRVW